MFNIRCDEIDKNDIKELNGYNSILKIYFWEFSHNGKNIKKFYRQDDHYELFVDPDMYTLDIIDNGIDILKNRYINGNKFRITWCKNGIIPKK